MNYIKGGVTLLLLFASALIFAQEDIFSKTNSLKYADYLMKSREYRAAVQEWERIRFMDPENDSISLRLLEAYQQAGMYRQGLERCQELFDDEVSSTEAALYEVKFRLRLDQYQLSRALIEDGSTQFDDSLQSNLQLGTRLLERDWKSAQDYASSNTIHDPYLLELTRRSGDLKRKSPLLASIMSGLIPGSGKMYSGRWTDGFMSLIFVGANAFGAYRGFSRDGTDSFYGWFFTAVGTGFYVGNIYGSHQAAKEYNQNHENHLYHEVEGYFYRTY